MAAAQAEALRQADLAKIPIWTGSKTVDQFSAEQWIERIQKAKTASGWTDNQTMSFVFNALRADSLLWYDSLSRSGVDKNVWNDFKTAFLQAYSSIRTTRSTIVNLADVKQQQNEPVVSYYPRVIKTIDDLESLVPEAGFPTPANPWPAQITGLAGWDGVADAIKTTLLEILIKTGATHAFNHMGLHLFLTNLKPTLRDELLKAPPATLYDAFNHAVTLERIHTEPKKAPQQAVAPVDEQSDIPSDEEDPQIAELSHKLKMLKQKRNKAQGATGNPNRQQSRTGQQQQQRASNDYNKCRYCKKPGHLQKVCNSRLKSGAPMVDKDGNPYKSVQDIGQQQQQQQQFSNYPQQPQQQQPQQFYNPFMAQQQFYAPPPPNAGDFY